MVRVVITDSAVKDHMPKCHKRWRWLPPIGIYSLKSSSSLFQALVPEQGLEAAVVEGFAFGAEKAAGDAFGAVIFDAFHTVAVAGAVSGTGAVLGENGQGLVFHIRFLSLLYDTFQVDLLHSSKVSGEEILEVADGSRQISVPEADQVHLLDQGIPIINQRKDVDVLGDILPLLRQAYMGDEGGGQPLEADGSTDMGIGTGDVRPRGDLRFGETFLDLFSDPVLQQTEG